MQEINMNSIIVAALLATQFAAVPEAKSAPEVTYYDIAKQAIFNCPAYKNNLVQIKPTLVFDLIGIERKYGIPENLRGILLATACENKALSGNLVPLRYWIQEKKPEGKINFNSKNFSRFFYQKTADAWMAKIIDRLPLVEKKCGKMSESDRWKVAWERGFGCHKKPKSFKLLRSWHTKIVKEKRAKKKEAYVCGC
tara:strand:- start:922 stop:1509 length:588 start_codon:yes stop_codon:yes gene_type:complete